MNLVPAVCTQCGAVIQVDSTKDAAICEFCGTPFVVDKAIHQYTTENTNNFYGEVTINNGNSMEELQAKMKAYITLSDEAKQAEIANIMINEHPDNVISWFEMARVCTKDFSLEYESEEFEKCYNALKKLNADAKYLNPCKAYSIQVQIYRYERDIADEDLLEEPTFKFVSIPFVLVGVLLVMVGFLTAIVSCKNLVDASVFIVVGFIFFVGSLVKSRIALNQAKEDYKTQLEFYETCHRKLDSLYTILENLE